jgi:hypothetical protein
MAITISREWKNGMHYEIMSHVIKSDEIALLSADQYSIGPPRDHHMLSVNQFEEVPLAADTDAAKRFQAFHAMLACDRQAVIVVKGSWSPLPPSFLTKGIV